jgi:hypothetical protein
MPAKRSTTFRISSAKGKQKRKTTTAKAPKIARGFGLSCCLLWIIAGGFVSALAVLVSLGVVAKVWPDLLRQIPAEAMKALAAAGGAFGALALALAVAQMVCGVAAWRGRRWGVIGLVLIFAGLSADYGWSGEWWPMATYAVTCGMLVYAIRPYWAKLR